MSTKWYISISTPERRRDLQDKFRRIRALLSTPNKIADNEDVLERLIAIAYGQAPSLGDSGYHLHGDFSDV